MEEIMSEKELIVEEKIPNLSVVDSTAVPMSSDEPRKSTENNESQSIARTDESEKACVEKPVELQQNLPIEMEIASKEPALGELKQADTDQKTLPFGDTVIANKSVCIEMTSTDEAAPQQKPYHQITPSIGSLGLLNQYASSSDEDDDSSSDSSSIDSTETESETDSDDDDSSVVSNNASNVAKETQLNTMANNILNDAMSRENYRDVSSDT